MTNWIIHAFIQYFKSNPMVPSLIFGFLPPKFLTSNLINIQGLGHRLCNICAKFMRLTQIPGLHL